MNFEPVLYSPLFVRDAPDINLVASGADPVELTVATGGSSWPLPVTPVLTDGRYLAPLRMREILDSVVGIPGLADAGEREVPLVTLTAEGTSMSLRAVYGGAAGKTPTELAGHWLSWRDQVSKTYAWGRERLTFLAGRDLLGWRSGSYSVKAKVYLASGDPVTVTLASGTLPEGCRYVTVDASYAAIAALVSGTIRAWDVSYSFSGRDSGNANASLDGFPLRLVLARQDVRVKEFVFCNSFGVEDRVYSSGRSNPKLEGASVAFLNGAVEQELRNDATEGREVFSGYLGSARESALWLDFLKAHERHILLSRGLARIIVDTQETDLQDNAIGSVKFTYHLGALDAGRHFDDLEGLGEYDPAQRYGALYVGDEPASEDLPTEDLFFLKTRLDEFPAADLDEDLLFLVQNPLTQAWGNASLNSIKEYLQQVITREDVRVWTGPWTDYSAGVAGYALSAGLGRDLYDRIRNIETHPTDLSNYYTKSQTDAAILAGIAGKVNADDLKSLTLNVGSAVVGTYNPIGSSDQTLTIAESNLTALLDDNYHPLHGEHDASAEKYFWIGGAKFIWHPAVGGTDGYLELQSAIVTTGDQIVISGTPGGSGGGGGGAGYIYELKDTLSSWIGRPSVSETQVLVFDPSANVHDKNGNNGAWKYVNASSIGGVTSVVEQTGAVTAAQIATALTSAGYKLTDHEYTNGYGLNLSNGEFSLTQAVRDSLVLADTALQAAGIKTLTLKVGTTTIGSAYNPIGSSNQTLTIAESNLTALLNDNYHPLYGEHDASAEKYFWIGGAKFIWHPAVGGTDGYLELQSAIVTTGDQIVNSGTPGGGGSGGGAGYLYELGDIYHDNDKTKVLRPDGQQRDNGDVLSFDSALGVWVALQKSSLLSGYALESYVDSEISDSILALNLGAASTYGVGTVASGNGGLVTGGSVYSAINDAVSSALKFQGITTTAISDGSTTNPIVINGSSYTAKKGDVVLYDGREFLWTGSAWEQLGDEVSWALKTTTISAGQGLTGGGTLAANRTISLNSETIASLALADTAYQKPPTGIPNGDIATPWVKVGTTQINLGEQQTSLAGLVNVTMSGKLTIGSAEIEWVEGVNGNPGYLKVNQALLTTGDQIVNSGTPGQGGGGSGAGYLYELGDVYHDTNKTTVLREDGTQKQVGDVLQYLNATKGWVAVAASSIGGVTSVVNQTGNVTVTQIADALTAAGYKLTDTVYTLPLAANGTRGGIQIGYSSSGKNYAVQLSSEKAYVNVPWTDTTYKLTLNGTVKGTTGGTDLGSFYAPTSSGTSGHALISGGANTAPSFRALVANDIPELPWSKITSGKPTTLAGYGITDAITADSYLMPTNTFGAKQKIWHNGIDNSFYALSKRPNITVTLTGFKGSADNLFNGDYGSYIELPAGEVGKILIESSTTFSTYTEGYYYISFYYVEGAASVSGRMFCKTGSTSATPDWVDLTDSTNVATSGRYIFRLSSPARLQATKWEFTITALQNKVARVTQIDYQMFRGDQKLNSAVTKYAIKQDLYGPVEINNTLSVIGNYATTLGGALGVNGSITSGSDIYIPNNKVIYFKDKKGTNRATVWVNSATVSDLYLGYGITAGGGNTYVDGNKVYLRYGSNHTVGVTLNNDGAVTIAGATTLSSTLAVTGLATLSGGATIPSGKTLKIGDATIEWVANSGNGYLKIDKPLLTVGDQIVNSGTPGGGGGGGGAGFLYELGDVLTDSDHTVVKQYNGTDNAANNNLFAFNGSKWYALKLGTNLAISSGTLNATNTTYSNGTGLALSNGVFSITSAYQTKIDNGASAYSTLTTSQAKNKVLASPSNASGAPSFRALVAADLPSIENLTNFSTRVYDATTSRTANYVLAAPNGSNGAATFRKLVAADIPSLTVSKISDIASNYVSIATANTITAKHTFSNGILLNTASSWTNSERAIAFSADGEDANIRYYYTDSNKGLTFNPSTGELRAAKFIKRGGTSDQFLKADGSTDSKTYLTSHQALYNLVINNSAGVAQITYKPGTSGTYSLTLTKVMVGLGNVDNLAASDYFTAISSTTSTPLSITVGGTTKTLSSLYATTAERPRSISGTAEAGGYNLNTVLAGGGAIRNVSSSSYWAHAPQGLGYFGAAIQVNPANLELGAMQFAYNMNYNGTTPTDKIWWRARNNDGWADDWHLIYDSTTLTKSVITGLLGNTTYASYHPDGYLPLSGGTMTGSIKLPNGSYINAESGYAMLGIGSGGETFYCGPGAEITNAFYLRSGNIDLTHHKAGTPYKIWDASNSNLSTVDWAANNLTVAGTSTFSDTLYVENRKYMQWKDSGGTYRNIFGLNNTNELLIGYGLSSVTGSATALYGETIRMNASSMTELVKTGGGATLMFRGSALNNAPGTILFRGGTGDSNGFKIEAEPYGTYGRVSLSFYTSNVSSGDAPYTPNWKRSMRIYYNGNIHLGVDGAFYPTVYSYGPIVIGTTTNNANLTVRGTITSTGDQVISSDASLKKNWRDLKYGVADIAKATAGVFDWMDGKGESAGTKAQDWMHLVPQLVHGEEGHMTLAYGQIAMLNTILLARRSEDHETRIKALELENAELRKEIERLRS